MIEEALAWLRLDCGASAQRLGYRREAASLRVRHRRCATAWRDHLNNTRAALLQSAAAAAQRRCALVLGAGLLRDVPWIELTGLFDEVVLVDVVFHPEAFTAARNDPRVTLLRADVTGCVGLLARRPGPVPAEDDLRPGLPGDVMERVDWIGSVNLWSQLPLLPCAWLARYGATETAVEEFGQGVLQSHLNWLENVKRPHCIVTEICQNHLLRDGCVASRTSLWPLLRRYHRSETRRWHWLSDPAGELPWGQTMTREVVAFQNE